MDLSAVVLGLAFGFFLERAGLGSGRKLAAQFYGTDLTVFKVMFTAIVTAMLGLFWLSRARLIDLSLITLSPTYLVPQLAGGLLFGAGFVIGGYCPGTSCVAAASGKADGLAVFGGMMAGILLYGELYSWIQPFADLTPMGRISLATLLAVRPGFLVGGVTLAALAAFGLADRFERGSGGMSRGFWVSAAAVAMLTLGLAGASGRSLPGAHVGAEPDSTAEVRESAPMRGGGCFH